MSERLYSGLQPSRQCREDIKCFCKVNEDVSNKAIKMDEDWKVKQKSIKSSFKCFSALSL